MSALTNYTLFEAVSKKKRIPKNKDEFIRELHKSFLHGRADMKGDLEIYRKPNNQDNKTISEVRNDYIDNDNLCHIDCWFSDDDNQEERTVAVIDLDSGKVIFFDNTLRGDTKVKESIDKVVKGLKKGNPLINNLNKLICEVKEAMEHHGLMYSPEDFNESRTSWERLAEAYSEYYYTGKWLSHLKKIKSKKTFTAIVSSSHGQITINYNTGYVISCVGDKKGELKKIVKFDIEEYRKYYGKVHDSYDILNLGYWNNEGVYEDPCQDWRENREERLSEEWAREWGCCDKCKSARKSNNEGLCTFCGDEIKFNAEVKQNG